MSSHVFARSLRAVSSRSLSTGNKASAATFAKLDFNSDGVLSRGEVVGGARRFNLTAEEAGALFDRLDKNEDNVVTPKEFAAHAAGASVASRMSFSSPESDFSAPLVDELFQSLDLDGDGQLSRDEVATGAHRFGMMPAEAMALFDVLDSDGDGALSPDEFGKHAWEASVGKHMSYSSPESDWGGPRADELFQSLDQNHDNVLDRSEVAAGAHKFGMSAAESMALFDRLDSDRDGVLSPKEWGAHAWDFSVGRNISYASPESDFVAPGRATRARAAVKSSGTAAEPEFEEIEFKAMPEAEQAKRRSA